MQGQRTAAFDHAQHGSEARRAASPAPRRSTITPDEARGRSVEVGPTRDRRDEDHPAMAELMRPYEAAKLYRLGDAHRLRLTLATVRLTVTGPPPPAGPQPAFLTRPPRLATDRSAPGPPRPLPTPTTPRSRPLATAAPTPSTAGSAPWPPPAAGRHPLAGTAAWCWWASPPSGSTTPSHPASATPPRPADGPLGRSSSTPRVPAGRVPLARSASAEVHMRGPR